MQCVNTKRIPRRRRFPGKHYLDICCMRAQVQKTDARVSVVVGQHNTRECGCWKKNTRCCSTNNYTHAKGGFAAAPTAEPAPPPGRPPPWGNSWLHGSDNPHDLMFWRIRVLRSSVCTQSVCMQGTLYTVHVHRHTTAASSPQTTTTNQSPPPTTTRRRRARPRRSRRAIPRPFSLPPAPAPALPLALARLVAPRYLVDRAQNFQALQPAEV